MDVCKRLGFFGSGTARVVVIVALLLKMRLFGLLDRSPVLGLAAIGSGASPQEDGLVDATAICF